jgi:Ca2+-binding RTX toxin-like protein
MASQTITADFTSIISVPEEGDVLVVKKGVTGIVSTSAISAATVADDRQIIINGHVEATASVQGGILSTALFLGDQGDQTEAADNLITIGKSGELIAVDVALQVFAQESEITNNGLISAATGIGGFMDETTIANKGSIIGTSRGIDLECDDLKIINKGMIRGNEGDAIKLTGDDSLVVNHGTIRTDSFFFTIEFVDLAGDQNVLVNHGDIIAKGTAFKSHGGDDAVVNFGLIKGAVDLGNGNNRFVNRGEVTDTVFGRDGDDEYFLYGDKPILSEFTDQGRDTVHANISFRLGENFEDLTLLGRGNINGTGNDDANVLLGNIGANRLNGDSGKDRLDGGLGNDRLTGGFGIDVFVFADGYGKDTITDLTFEDSIDLRNMSVAVNRQTVLDFASQVGDDIVIDFGLGDRLTIKNIDNENDLRFLFGGEE